MEFDTLWAVNCIHRTHSWQSNECFWLLKEFLLSSTKKILEHSDIWCSQHSQNASVNANSKSEEEEPRFISQKVSKNSSLGPNFTKMRIKKLICLQFSRKMPQNDVHLQWTWCSLRSKIFKYEKLVTVGGKFSPPRSVRGVCWTTALRKSFSGRKKVGRVKLRGGGLNYPTTVTSKVVESLKLSSNVQSYLWF